MICPHCAFSNPKSIIHCLGCGRELPPDASLGLPMAEISRWIQPTFGDDDPNYTDESVSYSRSTLERVRRASKQDHNADAHNSSSSLREQTDLVRKPSDAVDERDFLGDMDAALSSLKERTEVRAVMDHAQLRAMPPDIAKKAERADRSEKAGLGINGYHREYEELPPPKPLDDSLNSMNEVNNVRDIQAELRQATAGYAFGGNELSGEHKSKDRASLFVSPGEMRRSVELGLPESDYQKANYQAKNVRLLDEQTSVSPLAPGTWEKVVARVSQQTQGVESDITDLPKVEEEEPDKHGDNASDGRAKMFIEEANESEDEDAIHRPSPTDRIDLRELNLLLQRDDGMGYSKQHHATNKSPETTRIEQKPRDVTDGLQDDFELEMQLIVMPKASEVPDNEPTERLSAERWGNKSAVSTQAARHRFGSRDWHTSSEQEEAEDVEELGLDAIVEEDWRSNAEASRMDNNSPSRITTLEGSDHKRESLLQSRLDGSEVEQRSDLHVGGSSHTLGTRLQGSPARTFDAEGTLREGQLTLDDVATSTPPDGHRQVRGDRWLSGESENLSSIRETTGADHPMRSRSDQSGKFSRRDEPTSVDWQQPEQLAYVVLQIDVQATQLDNPPSKQYRQQLLKNLGETIVGIMHNAKLAVIDIREDSFVARQDRSSDSIVRLIRDSESLIEQIANHCEPSVPARIRGRCVIVAVSAKVVDAIEEAKVSAQRLFQTMPVDCVWFDHEIYQMLDQPIECEEIALASLDRQVVYELIKRDIATSGDMLCRAFDVEQLPWVGREAEMAALHGHWAYVVQTGEFRTLLVLGDMGVGRSRLIEMWRRQVGHNAHVFIGAASWFSSASSGSPYLLSLLNSHLYSLELEPPQGILGRVSSLASMQGETALQYRDLWSQALTELYNSTRPASQVAEDTVEWIIRSSVSEAPVLVIFDDLFLLDRSSQNLLENLMRQPPARTMLVIVSSHQEYEELLFSSLSQAERMEISPLSARESYKIIEALLPRTDDHREHLSRIVEQAEGNAQALLMLAQQYVDPASHSDYNRPSLADRLPMDAQQAILRQLSGLSSLERDTLRKAAAIGDRFWKSCVECLERLDISEGNWGLQDGVLISYVDDRNECLKSLSERGLIEPVEHSAVANELEFRFRNRLLRSVCLQQIPYTIRQQMHRHVAFWLMQHDENQLLIADLVNHLQLADNKDAAARCLLDAAELAFNRDRCRDALSLLSGHFDDPELQNPLLQMKALYLSGIAYQRMGDFAAAIRLHNSALQISWQLADHKSGSRYFLELGQSRAYLGDFASAYSDILNAQTLAQQVRDPDLLWRCRLQLAMLALLKGEAIQAREQLQEARRFLPETPTEHPLRWASLLYAMGWLYKLEGRWHESAQSLQESSNLRKNNNAQLPYAESLLQHGEFLFSMGDEQGAIPLLEQAVELSRSREAYQLLTRALMHLAHAYLRRRNTQQAYTLLLEAWQHCKVSNNNSNMTQISAAIAAVATLGRQSQEAMRFAQIAAQRVQSGLPIHRGWAYYFLGEAASGMSPERANQIFEPLPSPLPEGGIISYCFLKAVEMFKYCGEVANQLSALLALARALFTMGSTRTSAQILDRSIADAKQLGLSLLLERMENQRRLISGVEPALPVASISPNQSTLLIRRASSSDPSSNSPSSMPPSPQQTTPRISSAVPRPSFPPPLTSYEQPHKKK